MWFVRGNNMYYVTTRLLEQETQMRNAGDRPCLLLRLPTARIAMDASDSSKTVSRPPGPEYEVGIVAPGPPRDSNAEGADVRLVFSVSACNQRGAELHINSSIYLEFLMPGYNDVHGDRTLAAHGLATLQTARCAGIVSRSPVGLLDPHMQRLPTRLTGYQRFPLAPERFQRVARVRSRAACSFREPRS